MNEKGHNWMKHFIQYCLLLRHSVYNCWIFYKTMLSLFSVEFHLVQLSFRTILFKIHLKMFVGRLKTNNWLFEHKMPHGFILLTSDNTK